jgi:hypothetical protein
MNARNRGCHELPRECAALSQRTQRPRIRQVVSELGSRAAQSQMRSPNTLLSQITLGMEPLDWDEFR